MELRGDVKTETGKSVPKGSLVDENVWLDLADASHLFVKHTTSGRELNFQGPGRVMLCRHGQEQALIASGSVKSSAGVGVRPGAEVLLATPFGTLRYADAALEMQVTKDSASVSVQSGEANLDAPPKPGSSKESISLVRGPTGKGRLVPYERSPEAQIALCQKAAERAEQSGRDVMTPEPTADAGTLGERAASHVKARRTARGACASAAAATGLVADLPKRQALFTQVLRWEGLWRALPRDLSPKKR
jgi:hypothetical protein